MKNRCATALTLVLTVVVSPLLGLAHVPTDDGQPSRRYLVRPVGVGSNISVRARSTRQIQVRITDENDRPVPDLPVIFALANAGSNSIGSLGPAASAATPAASGAGVSGVVVPENAFAVTTDAEGIARVEFVAGDTPSKGSITATVQGSDSSWAAEVKVKKAHGFWTTRNTLLVIGGIAAAATGVAVATSGSGSKNKPNQRPDEPAKPRTHSRQ